MWIKFVDNYSSIDLVCESSRKTPKTQDRGPLEKSLAVVCRDKAPPEGTRVNRSGHSPRGPTDRTLGLRHVTVPKPRSCSPAAHNKEFGTQYKPQYSSTPPSIDRPDREDSRHDQTALKQSGRTLLAIRHRQ